MKRIAERLRIQCLDRFILFGCGIVKRSTYLVASSVDIRRQVRTVYRLLYLTQGLRLI